MDAPSRVSGLIGLPRPGKDVHTTAPSHVFPLIGWFESSRLRAWRGGSDQAAGACPDAAHEHKESNTPGSSSLLFRIAGSFWWRQSR